MTVRDLLDLCGGFFLGLIVAWVSMGSIKAHISDEVNKVRLDVAAFVDEVGQKITNR